MSDPEMKASLVDANGPVSLTITNSTVVVTNVTSSPTDGAKKASFTEDHDVQSPKNLVEEKYAELCKIVNENTLKTTSVTITEDLDSDLIKEPDFEIFPQMRRINDYFISKEDGRKSKSRTAKKILPGKTKSKKQIDEEPATETIETANNNEFVTLDDLVRSTTLKTNLSLEATEPITAIISPAGSGKTTVLKRMARRTLELGSNSPPDEPADEKNHLKMIHYLEIKDIKRNDQLKPSQLLFGGLYKDEAEENDAYQWLVDHQSEAILYLDGLNLAMWRTKSSNPNKIRPFEKSSWTDILYNIISRNIIPHVKLVITSRDVKDFELPVEIRPNDVISLEGFSTEDTQKLFLFLIGDHGVEFWEKMNTAAPPLLTLVSSPLFLLLLVAEIAKDPTASVPVTVTEFYDKMVLSLSPEDTTKEHKQTLEVVRKLKSLAHQGMVDGRSVFYEHDLMKYGLSFEATRDLMLNASRNKLFSRHFFDTDSINFFKTQQFQEFMAASFITEVERKKFSQLTKKLHHESQWSVVWKFVSGILHHKSIMKRQGVSHWQKKQKVFDEAVRSSFFKGWNGAEFLATIYESNDDDFIQSFPYLPSLALTQQLTSDEAHMFGAVMARRRSLAKVEIVDLWRCGIDDNLIDVIVQNLKGFKVQVEILNLRDNFFTTKGLNSILAHLDADQIWIDFKRMEQLKCAYLEWNNIRKIDWKCFEMTNRKSAVTFEGEFNGCFDKQSKKLSLFYKSSIEKLAEPTPLISFFEPEVMRLSIDDEDEPRQVAEIKNPKPQRKRADSQMSWNFMKNLTSLSGESGDIRSDYQVYTCLRHFFDISKRNMEFEMKMVLLDCRSQGNVDSSQIEFCVSKFKTKFLDILMDDKTAFDSKDVLTEFESRAGVKLKFHWWFKIDGIDDVTNLIPIVQENKVENLRLHFAKGISFVVAASVLTTCKLQKLTLVHENDDKSYKKEHHKLAKVASRQCIELELVLHKRGNTAWQAADSNHSKSASPITVEDEKSSED